MAGYEAMQRGMGGGDTSNSPQTHDPSSGPAIGDQADPQSPQYGASNDYQPSSEQGSQSGDNDVWGTDSDPWADKPDVGSGEGSGEGGGIISQLWDMFNDS